MIPIQSSNRIIKNFEVSEHQDISVINTREIHPPVVERDEVEYSQREIEVDWEAVKDEIRRQVYSETESKRKQLLEEAGRTAEELKEKAVKRGYEEGYEEGYEKGYTSGLNEAKKEGAVIKDNAVQLIEQAKFQVNQYFDDSRDKIIKLAAEMAESIVHSEIDASSENILSLVKPILRKFGKFDSIIITCDPHSAEALNDRINELEEICPGSKFFILQDKNLDKNSCIIENEYQIIDLQVKEQIRSILDEIIGLE